MFISLFPYSWVQGMCEERLEVTVSEQLAHFDRLLEHDLVKAVHDIACSGFGRL